MPVPSAAVGAAGARNRLVTVQQLTESIGASGRPVETWTSLAKVWMERMDMTGAERFRADQLSARYDTRWRMPYRSDMDPETVNVPKKRRLLYQGRIYDIVTAMPIGLHDTVELLTISKAVA